MALHPVGNFREQQDVSSRRGGPVYRIVWSGNGSESFPDVGRLDGALCGAVFGIVWSGNGSEPFPDVGHLDGALCGAVLPEPKGHGESALDAIASYWNVQLANPTAGVNEGNPNDTQDDLSGNELRAPPLSLRKRPKLVYHS
jgi:hypothetical protein